MDPVPLVAPIIVCVGPDCLFYRSAAAAIDSGIPLDAKIFDAGGRRLEVDEGNRLVDHADAADELADLLRQWLGYTDALRESTQFWSLSLLVQASVDHLGYTA